MISVLIRGECLEAMRDLSANSVDMILCDLPYGTTQNEWDSIIPLDAMWEEYRRVAKPNAAIVLTADQPFTTTLIASNMREFRYCWTWQKSRVTGFLNAKKMPLKNTEDIAVFYRELPTYNPQGVTKTRKTPVNSLRKGGRNYGKIGVQEKEPYVQDLTGYPTQILPFASVSDPEHPTQKPVDLMRYFIETYSNRGDTVLDNCMGSGTTGVACALSGRNFIGIEMSAEYVALAERRIRKQIKPLAAFGPAHVKGDTLKVIDRSVPRVPRVARVARAAR